MTIYFTPPQNSTLKITPWGNLYKLESKKIKLTTTTKDAATAFPRQISKST